MANDQQPHINMAAATGNGPLVPQKMLKITRQCIRQMGDNAPIKQICFLLAISRSKSLQMLWWQNKIYCHHRHIHGAFKGFRPTNHRQKAYLLAWGIYPIDMVRLSGSLTSICCAKGSFPVVAAMMVMLVFFQ